MSELHDIRLISLQIGLPRDYGTPTATDPHDKPWTTGFFKTPHPGPLELDWLNLAGDGQADLENHGGRDKAICAYSAEHYPLWRSELQLPELPYGAFGENFTIGGIHEAQISLGDEFAIGTAVIQVSQPRQPCWKLARRWKMRHLPGLVVENGRTGWYFRVLRPGIVSPGDDFRLLARPCPAWTISRANQVYYHHKHDAAAAAELAAVPWLSASWRDPLESRANLLAANRLSS